ncbi:group I truncated hemoglobin [Pleionea mediterranea]|jgi:hemoglobin|nr:group 1 truncated hemoglobin [Pleionea mediterranea]
MNQTLFYRVGGEAAVEAAVNRFYDKFLQQESIIDFFENVSIPEQKNKFRLFFTQILGGPYTTSNIEIRRVHAPLVERGLNDQHYDLFLKLMEQTLRELEIPEELIEEFIDLTESFRKDVLNK